MVGRLVAIATFIEFIWIIFIFPKFVPFLMDFAVGDYAKIISILFGVLIVLISFSPLMIAMILHSSFIENQSNILKK